MFEKGGFDTTENEPYYFGISSSREFEFKLRNFEPLTIYSICTQAGADHQLKREVDGEDTLDQLDVQMPVIVPMAQQPRKTN